MPAAGYRPPTRLFLEAGHCSVRFCSETGGVTKDFDFTTLPISQRLQEALARAFDIHVGPAGAVKAVNSAEMTFRMLRYFAETLAAQSRPPVAPADLAPRHLDEFFLRRKHLPSGPMGVATVRALLRYVDGLTPQFLAKCAQKLPGKRSFSSRGSYTASEEERIMAAARATVRAAADRIRANRELLERWRAGDPQMLADPRQNELGRLLDGVERDGEVPRTSRWQPEAWVGRHGSVEELTHGLHLSVQETAAFVVLLVRLTGENGSTIISAPAAHHRADGDDGSPASALVDLDKPRRGRRRYYTAAFSDVPSWAAAPREEGELSGYEQLHTSFGVYMLALDLTSSARQILRSSRLLAFWSGRGGIQGRGFRDTLSENSVSEWGAAQQLLADPAEPGQPAPPLRVGVGRLRVTHAQREQRPVGHTERTHADLYLRRDRTALAEHQKLVAEVLRAEVDKARAAGRIGILTEADLTLAATDLAGVASLSALT